MGVVDGDGACLCLEIGLGVGGVNSPGFSLFQHTLHHDGH